MSPNTGQGGVIPVRREDRARVNEEAPISEAGAAPDNPQEIRDPGQGEQLIGQAAQQREDALQPPGTGGQAGTPGETQPSTADIRATERPQRTAPTQEPEPKPGSKPDPKPGPNPEDGESLITIGTQGPSDIKSLCARCWTLATRLSQSNGLENLVQPLPGAGLGFILADVPDPALAETLDDDALALVSSLWWQLAACCELTCAPEQQTLPHLKQDSVLSRAMESGDADLLFDNVWTMDPGNVGSRLWWRLDDRGWRDLLSLMHSYRTLRRAAKQSGNPVWDQ